MADDAEKRREIGRKLAEMFDVICVVMTVRPKIKNCTLLMLDSLGVLTPENVSSGKIHIQYDMPNVAREMVKNAVPRLHPANRADSVFWCTLNHYYTLAAAYHSGAERALVFEDDAAIMKDCDEVLRYLDGVPAGFDFVNFGCLPTGGADGVPNFKRMLHAPGGTELYARLENGRNAHAFGMSRRFMEELLRKIERRMTGREYAELLVNDQWFNSRRFRGFGMWFSRKPVFVQQWDPSRKCGRAVYDMYYKLYDGVRKKDYAFADGRPESAD